MPLGSKILSLSDCTRTVTLLPRASTHLNKSLTRLKSDLCWNTIYPVFEREIWQRIKYFFRVPPRSKVLSPSDCTWVVTFLPRPSIHLTKFLTRLKGDLFWNIKIASFEREIWQRIEYFFVYFSYHRKPCTKFSRNYRKNKKNSDHSLFIIWTVVWIWVWS